MISKQTIIDALDANVIVGDGHTIFAPTFYEPYFSAETLEEAGLITVHRSNMDSPKGTIFVNGEPVEELKGVYNLNFLEWIRQELDLSHAVSNGRGFRAQEIVRKIQEWVVNDD
jgi:hypothetical protein